MALEHRPVVEERRPARRSAAPPRRPARRGRSGRRCRREIAHPGDARQIGQNRTHERIRRTSPHRVGRRRSARPAPRAGSGRRRPSCWTAARRSSAATRCSGGTRSCWPGSPPGSSPVSARRPRTGVAEIRTGSAAQRPAPGRHRGGGGLAGAGGPPAPGPTRRRRWSRMRCAARSSSRSCEPGSPGLGSAAALRHVNSRSCPRAEAGVSEHEPYELLRSVADPPDLRRLTPDQLPELAAEIRAFLIDQVSQTGGHLGPNLGVVELTIALHRVFDSPRRPDHLRHRPPELRAQDADRSAGRLRDPAAEGRPVRLPEPGGVRARLGRELPRLDSLSYADGIARGAAAAGQVRHRGRPGG